MKSMLQYAEDNNIIESKDIDVGTKPLTESDILFNNVASLELGYCHKISIDTIANRIYKKSNKRHMDETNAADDE